MKKVLTCIIALLAWAGNASADELQIEDIHIAPGQTQTVAVKLENESHRYIMIQFDLQLPKGVRIAKDEATCRLNPTRSALPDRTVWS